MSRPSASVGFSPMRWNGARKMPNVMPLCAMALNGNTDTLPLEPRAELDHEPTADDEEQSEPRGDRHALPEHEAAAQHADRREGADVHAEKPREFPRHEIHADPITTEHDGSGDD